MLNVLNLANHPNPVLAVDLGLICFDKGQLKILLLARKDANDVGGAWALPGGIVHIDESLDQTAKRVLQTKVKLDRFHLEQLETFGEIERDPRGRVVTVAYFALTSDASVLRKRAENDSLTLATINISNENSLEAAQVLDENGQELRLAFDHQKIIHRIIIRLKGKIDYTPIALSLLPERFTLREVQQVFEAILQINFAKPAFRRKLIDRKIIEPTGQLETASNFRPAELYKRSF